MIALRGKIKRVNPQGSPRNSPLPSPPRLARDPATGQLQVPATPAGSWAWTGLWAFDAVPDAADENGDDPALLPPHRRPRPAAGQPHGFVYKFQEVVDPAAVLVPSMNEELEEEERRRKLASRREAEIEEKRRRAANASAAAAAKANSRAHAAASASGGGGSKRRKGLCRVGSCPKTRQGNCDGMCRAHFQQFEEKRPEKEKEAGAAGDNNSNNSDNNNNNKDTASASTSAEASDAMETEMETEKTAPPQAKTPEAAGAGSSATNATPAASTSTVAANSDAEGAAGSEGDSKKNDSPAGMSPRSTPPSSAATSPAGSTGTATTATPPVDTSGSVTPPTTTPKQPIITFATPSDDGQPFTDASIKFPGQCPPSGRWTGYFENETRRKDRATSRVPEVFYLFFNATPPKDATTVFTDVEIVGETESKSKEDKGDDTTGASADKAKTTDTDDAKPEEARSSPKPREGALPPGHLHVRGSGTNQYGKWELIGGYDPVLGVLRCQRIYVNLASDEKSSSGTPRRGRASSSGADDPPTVRTSSRKRQISWRKASAVESEQERTSTVVKKRQRTMSDAAAKAPAAGGLSISAAKAAAAAQAATGFAPAGILSPRGAIAVGKAQQIQRKPGTPRGAAATKRVAKGTIPAVALAPAPPVVSIKLPPVGDPKKAKFRAAHYFLYEKIDFGEGTPKSSPNSISGRPSSPAGSVGTAHSSPGGGAPAQFIVYEGELNNGLREGRGVCLYSNGLLYEGEWRRNKEHGKGILLTGDRKRVVYEGDWERGKMHGHGTYYYPTDSPFVNIITGAPTPTDATNDPRDARGGVYTGDFKENARHGVGTYTMPNGSVYEGDWRDNTPHGRGTFRWIDGSAYTGLWNKGKRHGQGILHAADGFSYDGMWCENSMEGKGVATYPKGQKYEGAWVGGKREGRGTIVFTNGAVYEGRFRDDLMEGQGTLKMTRAAVVPKIEREKGAESGKDKDQDGDVEMKDAPDDDAANEQERDDWMIPIQFQSDISSIHQKAGFTEGGE